MQYLDFDKLEAIDPAEFRSTQPYPYINPRGLLTDEGYQALLDNMPDISLFEKKFGYERIAGQKPHDRYSLEYSPDTPVAQPWAIGFKGGIKPNLPAAVLLPQFGKVRGQQAQFSHSWMGKKDLGYGPKRPAAAGQVLIQLRVATGAGAHLSKAPIVPLPDVTAIF